LLELKNNDQNIINANHSRGTTLRDSAINSANLCVIKQNIKRKEAQSTSQSNAKEGCNLIVNQQDELTPNSLYHRDTRRLPQRYTEYVTNIFNSYSAALVPLLKTLRDISTSLVRQAHHIAMHRPALKTKRLTAKLALSKVEVECKFAAVLLLTQII